MERNNKWITNPFYIYAIQNLKFKFNFLKSWILDMWLDMRPR